MRIVLLLLAFLVALVTAAPPSGTCPSPSKGVFGVSQKTLLELRGGEVIEAETLQDVESILLKAGSNNQLVVIDFSATWCAPWYENVITGLVLCSFKTHLLYSAPLPLIHSCIISHSKQIAPLFESLSNSMSDVVFLKVDVDENPDTAAKYSVSAMPTFLFIKQGTVVDRLMGANPAALQQLIDEHK